MEKSVLVIGGGVNGLSTGICLLEDGWDVTIYSEEFSPNTTSDVAAALWYPFLSAPVEKTNVWGSRTYDILKLLATEKGAGIDMTQTFEYFRSSQPDPVWKSTVDNFERITEDLPSDYVECFSFMTQVIEMPLYLEWLMNRYNLLGGKLEKRRVNDFSEVPEKFQLVVNCTGLSSGELCNDPEVYPVRGQIIRIKPKLNQMHLDQQIPTLSYIVPRSNDMILGGVAQEGNWSLEPTQEDRNFILEKCSKIIPDLKNAEIIEDIVGLRPGRAEVRLEKEQISGKVIIHNYGHGGSGVTLSWGCAEEVVELANE
ncbi:MAG: FAD-dependent oxidoreductase [Candidatus Thermoplasmatota archaeon]|nr:FAD-dependent oxidoreductase [Candidatus Thermoplasmatota archaeon]